MKIIKGSDVDPELSAISTAVATKLDTAGAGIAIATTTVALDFSGLIDVAPAAADEFVFGDVSDGDNIRRATFAVIEAALNHDSLTGFVANEHIDHTSVSVSTAANSGLTGGGTIAATRSLSVDINGTSLHAGLDSANDLILVWDASLGALRKAPIDDAFNAVGGTVPDSRNLTAGTGLTGGGTLAADRTFNVAGGNGIIANANDVELDINGLTGAVAVLTDSIAFYDASAATVRKESLTDIKTLVTPDTATTTAEGIVELATQTEVDTGTDTSRVVTPSTLANYAGLSGLGADMRISDTTGYDFRSVATYTTIDDGTTPAWSWVLSSGGIYHLEWFLYVTSATQAFSCQIDFSGNHFSTGLKINDTSVTDVGGTMSAATGYNSDITLFSAISAPGDMLCRGVLTVEPSAACTVSMQVKQDTGAANESMVEHGSWAKMVTIQ